MPAAGSIRLGVGSVDDVELGGKTVLLTGATGGLGRAIARALAERGTTLVLSARGPEALEELSAGLVGEHRIAPADLAQEDGAERLAADAGEIDGLVANAGMPGTGAVEGFSTEEVRRAIRVNLEAPIVLARAFLGPMAARGEGQMVFVSSLSGKAASPRSSVYNATKFGLRGFALGLRTDLAKSGVGVSIVSPGFVRDAGMFAKSGARSTAGLGTTTPERVASAVARALERNPVEVAVAPLRQRALAHIGLAAPTIAVRAQSGGVARRATTEIDAGHRAGLSADEPKPETGSRE
jgi:short-subunit dehydrogenase